jgi:hypothetical protein
MHSIVKPLLRPLPLLGLSTGSLVSLYLATATTATLSTKHSPSANTTTMYPTTPYTPRHTTWPYNPSDFTRQDSKPDTNFYSSPRFVTHIDDLAIASLRDYYSTVLPTKGRILDFCSSWTSHYPPSIETAAQKGDLQITGMGMNAAELAANDVLNAGRLLVDLNESPDITAALKPQNPSSSSSSSSSSSPPEPSSMFDSSTCVVSIDYLTSPVPLLTSLRTATKPGGTVHLVISNRCFPTKAISRWLRVDEAERLQMVGDFLHFAGWKRIEIVEISDGKVHREGEEAGEVPNGLQGLFGMIGMGGRRDPLWVVRGVNEG